jgi:hypothetical protein
VSKNTLYLNEEKILFGRAKSGFFEPMGYNVDIKDGEFVGEKITKGSFLNDFVMFIRFSERKKITSGKNRGKLRDGFAETYQWVYALKALGITERMNAERLIGVFSRQS